MKFRLIVIAVSAVLVVGGIGLYADFAKGPGMGMPPPPPEMMGPPSGPHHMPPPPPPPPHGQLGMLDDDTLANVGANKDQIQLLKKQWFDYQDKQVDLMAELQKAEILLQRNMVAENPNSKAVLQVVDKINQVRGDLFKQAIELELQQRQILGDVIIKKLQRCERMPGGRHCEWGKEDKEHHQGHDGAKGDKS